jgi:hypothetical protein
MAGRRGLVLKAGRMAALALVVLVVLTPAQVFAQEETYTEDFDDGQAQGWGLEGEYWIIEGDELLGRGHGWAVYDSAGWSDLNFSFRLSNLVGTLHTNVHVFGPTRYIVSLSTGEGVIIVHVFKQLGSDLFTDPLGSGTYELDDYAYAALKEEGLSVSIDVGGGWFGVWIEETQVIGFEDADPLPVGTIAFETLDDSMAVIDDVYVVGIPAAVMPPGEATQPEQEGEQPTPGMDLVVLLEVAGFEEDGRIIVLGAIVQNRGDTETPPTEIIVANEVMPDIRQRLAIQALPPGGSAYNEVRLELPAEWAGTQQRFIAQVDPDGVIEEAIEENNFFVSQLITIPGGGGEQPGGPAAGGEEPGSPTAGGEEPSGGDEGGGGAGWLLPVLIGGGVVLAGAAALVIRGSVKAGQRSQLEKEAQENRPPDDCTPGERYVEVEHEFDLKRMKVTEIRLASSQPGSSQQRHAQSVKGRVPDDLDGAIRARRRGEKPEQLAQRIGGLAAGLAAEMAAFASREPERSDLLANAHLEGIEVTSTYTLYRCEGRGAQHAWKKVMSWKTKKQQARDDAILYLTGVEPADASMPQWMPQLISGPLREYVERY